MIRITGIGDAFGPFDLVFMIVVNMTKDGGQFIICL